MIGTGRHVVATLLVLAGATVSGAAAPEPESLKESWDAIFIRNSKIGFFHIQVIPVKDGARELRRVKVDMSLSYLRSGDLVNIETLYGTIETLDGQVLRLDSRTLVSKQETRIAGDVVDGKMTLTFSGTGQSQQKTLDWGPDVRGPYGAEMSMAGKPMEPGERREIKVFIPDYNNIGLVKLEAKVPERIQLGGGAKRELLRVEQVTLFEGKLVAGMTATHWVDSSGQILRTSSDALGGYETYRTDKVSAMRGSKGPKLDLNAAFKIAVRNAITKPTERSEITYDLTIKGDDLKESFPSDRRQTLTPSPDASRGRLVVRRVGPGVGEPGPEAAEPQFLKPNVMVTSEDGKVVALARMATAGLTDPWQKATAISHWVFENLKKKSFETTFAAASEVARDLQGDCTEHSVLAAAMCRASGIPCRVVIGVVYVESEQTFGYHMWDEVYIAGRWVAIDPTWDQSLVDATHLKLGESSLDGIAPFETFLHVVRLVGKTTIEPVEVR